MPDATASCRPPVATVREYVYKPDEPRGNLVSNEVFVFSPDPVLDALDEIAEREDELEDLGHELLPRLVDAGPGPRAPLRRLLARRGHDPGVLGLPSGAGRATSRRSTSTTRPGRS